MKKEKKRKKEKKKEGIVLKQEWSKLGPDSD